MTADSTLSTGGTERRDYLCYAVHDLDCIVLTDRNAVSETDTAVLAKSGTAIETLNCLAGLNSVKVESGFRSIAVAVTVNDSGHWDYPGSRSA